MKRIAIACMFAFAICLVAPTAAFAQTWIAYAGNGNGWGYGSGYSEEDARGEAIDNCEHNSGYTCPSWRSVSVRSSWHLVIVKCGSSGYIAGGSKHDYPTARRVASQKLGRSRCRVVSRQ